MNLFLCIFARRAPGRFACSPRVDVSVAETRSLNGDAAHETEVRSSTRARVELLVSANELGRGHTADYRSLRGSGLTGGSTTRVRVKDTGGGSSSSSSRGAVRGAGAASNSPSSEANPRSKAARITVARERRSPAAERSRMRSSSASTRETSAVVTAYRPALTRAPARGRSPLEFFVRGGSLRALRGGDMREGATPALRTAPQHGAADLRGELVVALGLDQAAGEHRAQHRRTRDGFPHRSASRCGEPIHAGDVARRQPRDGAAQSVLTGAASPTSVRWLIPCSPDPVLASMVPAYLVRSHICTFIHLYKHSA